MKVLESSPKRYDRGMKILFFGNLDQIYDRLISDIQKGQKVLDIGCGTGALILKAAQRGAQVKGIDINAQMLEVAKEKAEQWGLEQMTEFQEKGVSELDKEEEASYDAVTSGLCFSELSEDEIRYALRHIKRILKKDGLLLIADEVRPQNILRKIIHWLIKIPLWIVTYIGTQTSTRAVRNLPDKIKQTGFLIERMRFNSIRDFMELKARNRKDKAE
ncbi:MAG: methyltransferase domain-containing protein [Candidatus Aminicenantes bacterium]|nr:methyltransferase domain-containing protein [Candidatus Aminicenantes bacterium]